MYYGVACILIPHYGYIVNLGNSLREKYGNFSELCYFEAIRLNPNNYLAYLNIGVY